MSNAHQSDPAVALSPPAEDLAELHVQVVDDGWQVVAHVTGEIDISTCERLRDAIEPHLGPRQRVVLDLSGVTFMDTSSLGVLEHASTLLAADGGSLILRNPSHAARRLLSAAEVAKVFRTELA